MTQRDDYVNDLMSLHVRYYQGWQRCQPDVSGYGDCSGVVCWATRKVGIDFGCTGSFALARLGHQAGTGLTIDQARHTKGAWVFRGINQGQGGVPGRDPGHIGTSLGNGQTFEARGRISGVGVFDFDSLQWAWACKPPHMAGFDQAAGGVGAVASRGVTNLELDFVGVASNGHGGYWIARHAGAIYSYGATYHGGVNALVTDITSTPDGGGYWMVGGDGGVFALGNAHFYGSMGGKSLNKPVVGISSTRTGRGYWLVASDGGIFSYGDAKFHGSTGGIHLNQPIVGMAPTVTDGGYWLVAADGGVFAFGDAKFLGSTGGLHLNQPIIGMVRSPSGRGYWLVARDGNIFGYGDAANHGSMKGVTIAAPVTGLAATPSGQGYWLVASDGGIFAFGDAKNLGDPIGL